MWRWRRKEKICFADCVKSDELSPSRRKEYPKFHKKKKGSTDWPHVAWENAI
jgi:hypothetical protein